MFKAEHKDYVNYIKYIDKSSCGAVYPYSIAKKFQQGDIFSESHSFLYWHYCGFAFLYGAYDERFLEMVYNMLIENKSTRRFILFAADEHIKRFFGHKDNLVIEKRYFFEYKKDSPTVIPDLPSKYKLCEINSDLLNKLNGSITPYFSWDEPNDFLERGKGYCIMDRNNAAAWAFTAAVSDEEIDIGIETNREYQRKGLAYIAALRMIQYCFAKNKRPVWACHCQNIASKKLAEKLGFSCTSECYTVKSMNLGSR